MANRGILKMKSFELINFENEVADKFEAGLIRSPIHLSGGNEGQLIKYFRDVKPSDWVFSTHRSHYHALLHGIPPDEVMRQILDGHSMSLKSEEHRFYTSSIVGGILPIALGVAFALKANNPYDLVHCFIGDMASNMGIFYECHSFAVGHDLPIIFVIEDNGMSTDTPTSDAWGHDVTIDAYGWEKVVKYSYKRTWPHCGTGKHVEFV